MRYKIAAVICTYNRARYLKNALESFKTQLLPASAFQLIVIDNNSTDETAAVTKKFIADNPSLAAFYYLETNPGLSAARNRGWQEADAPVIAYMDDDAIAGPGWLQAFVDFFDNNKDAVGAGGKVVPLFEDGEPVWMSKYLNGYAGNVDYGQPQRIFDEHMKYPSGCNMAWGRQVLEKAGGFNKNLQFRSDDKYIFFAVKNISNQVWWVPGAAVDHVVDHERLKFDNFRKLYLKTGNEEKIRLKGSVAKLFDYIFKLCASVGIYLLFAIRGQPAKGKYVLLAQYYTLKGFLMKKVFVR